MTPFERWLVAVGLCLILISSIIAYKRRRAGPPLAIRLLQVAMITGFVLIASDVLYAYA